MSYISVYVTIKIEAIVGRKLVTACLFFSSSHMTAIRWLLVPYASAFALKECFTERFRYLLLTLSVKNVNSEKVSKI